MLVGCLKVSFYGRATVAPPLPPVAMRSPFTFQPMKGIGGSCVDSHKEDYLCRCLPCVLVVNNTRQMNNDDYTT